MLNMISAIGFGKDTLIRIIVTSESINILIGAFRLSIGELCVIFWVIDRTITIVAHKKVWFTLFFMHSKLILFENFPKFVRVHRTCDVHRILDLVLTV